MTRVKFCGLTDAAALQAAIDAGADAVGFVVDVSVTTHREIPVARAADLIASVPADVAAVAVTMPTDPTRLQSIAERTGCDAIQLHGIDNPTEAGAFADAVSCPTVFATAPRDDAIDDLAAAGDALLLDAADVDGAGGTGRTVDWSSAGEVVDELAVPVALAGGLTPATVAEAIRTVDPCAVDVSSGIEDASGAKDPSAMAAFADQVAEAAGVTA